MIWHSGGAFGLHPRHPGAGGSHTLATPFAPGPPADPTRPWVNINVQDIVLSTAVTNDYLFYANPLIQSDYALPGSTGPQYPPVWC